VVQTDNNEFYLEHDIYKKKNSAGWIFLDYENDLSSDDKNIVIYGHNTRKNIMFHSLRYYKDLEYFKNHQNITFNTIYGNFEWEVFTFLLTNTEFRYIDIHRKSDDEWRELLEQMKLKSMHDIGQEVTLKDRVLLLSTCTENGGTDMRYVLGAKLILQ